MTNAPDPASALVAALDDIACTTTLNVTRASFRGMHLDGYPRPLEVPVFCDGESIAVNIELTADAVTDATRRRFRAWPLAVWFDETRIGCLYPTSEEYFGLTPYVQLRVPPKNEPDFKLSGPSGVTELRVIVALAQANPFQGVHHGANPKLDTPLRDYATWAAVFGTTLVERLSNLPPAPFVVHAKLRFRIAAKSQ